MLSQKAVLDILISRILPSLTLFFFPNSDRSSQTAIMAYTSSGDNINAEGGQGSSYHLEKLRTAGGNIANTDQPSLPVVHRRLANPAPLGLLSFATGIFLISILGVHARGIETPNILVGVLMFFGGVCQFIAGIMEFVAGNTFGATVFPSYAAFNFSYAMIFIPGTGIIVCKMAFSYPDSTIANNVAAYTDEATGQLRPEFNEALAMFCWAWFILTVIYTIAAVRSSWVLFLTLFFLDVELVLLAAGYMANSSKVLTAANSVGFVVGFFSCE